MSDKHLRRTPQVLSGKTAWWYEEKPGISVVAQLYDLDGKFRGTTITNISWRALRNAMARKDRKPPSQPPRKGRQAKGQ